MATGALTLGPNVPLVTMPISSPDGEKILVPSLAITLPDGLIQLLFSIHRFVNHFLYFSNH